MKTRQTVLRGIILAVFAILVARLCQIQILHGAEYRRASEQNRIRLIRREAARGVIYDRRGRILATSRLSFDIIVTPNEFCRQPGAVADLARILGVRPQEVQAQLGRREGPFKAVTVASDVPFDVATRIAEEALHLPGMRLESRPLRHYPRGPFAAHVLGYVRDISSTELERLRDAGYTASDKTGKQGVERVQEAALRGTDGGEQVEVDASGNLVDVLGRVPPVGGEPVVLNLDTDVQAAAEAGLSGRRGAAVALDVATGQVLALASSPPFDPNTFCGRITGSQWRYLNGSARPQQNRATAALYEPGSVAKLITAAAAIEEGRVAAGSRFFCPGYYQLRRWRFRCWARDGHGSLDFVSGFAQSCNVMFIRLGRAVGRPGLERWARAFGLGSTTGIDLSDESSGLIPNPRWKRKRLGLPWYPGDTCQISVGQGGLLITPVQAAVVAAAIANGGYLVTPRLVRKIGTHRVDAPPPTAVGIKPSTAALLRRGMAAVVQRGTARGIWDPSFPVAGKTGTAENPHGKPHAWFVGFAPVDHPQVAVAVIVEQGGSGAAVAPVGASILRAALAAPTQVPRGAVAGLPLSQPLR
jgi:penicillin-binding protein 2